jgi:hypothetical protein
MYSKITKKFKVEGKYTKDDKKWIHLGTFKAKNTFGEQEFFLSQKIVRYIKLTILESYGKWSHFTLTQVQIRGMNQFEDAHSNRNNKLSLKNIKPKPTVEKDNNLEEYKEKEDH